MTELLARSGNEMMALLCLEPTPQRCHRRLIAERMQEFDASLELIHLV